MNGIKGNAYLQSRRGPKGEAMVVFEGREPRFPDCCPCCGEGRLFRRYLKPAGTCAHCHEPYGDMRTDDAAPWLTILVVGHVVGPLIVISERNFEPPTWLFRTFRATTR